VIFSQHLHTHLPRMWRSTVNTPGWYQLLGHVLADALQRLATPAGGVLWLSVDLAARQVCGSFSRLGSCFSAGAFADCSASISAATAARLVSSVSSSRLFLLGVVSLALGGELQSLEDRALVCELGNDRLLERQLCVGPRQPLAKLLRVQRVEVVGYRGPCSYRRSR
jgi:hypothetical protein